VVDEGVVVEQEAAVGLAHYLTEIGRLGNRTARDVGAAIQSSVNSQWGSAKVKGFQDQHGPGWIVDISSRFQDEVLYAVVRTNKGKRHVVEVVDDEKLKAFVPGVKPQKKSDNNLDQQAVGVGSHNSNDEKDASVLIQQQDKIVEIIKKLKIENKKLQDELAAIRASDPEKPALLRWKVLVKKEIDEDLEETEVVDKERETTIGNIGAEISGLIANGVSVEHIVVWSKKQQPKVKVELE